MTKIRTRTKTGSVKAVHNPSSLTRDSDSDQAVSNNIINLIRPRMNNSCIRPVKVIRGKSVDDKTISISINSTNNLNSNPSSDDDFYLRQLHHQHLRQPSTNLNNAPSHATYRLDHQPGAHQSEPAILPVTSTHSSLLLSSSSSTTAAAIITTAARERRAESASNTHNHQSNALFHPNSQLRPSEQTIPTQFLLPSHQSKHHYNHPHPLNQTYRPSCVLSDTLEIKQQQHPPQRPSRKKFNLLSRPGSSANQSTLQAIQSFLPSPNQLGSALQNLQINPESLDPVGANSSSSSNSFDNTKALLGNSLSTTIISTDSAITPSNNQSEKLLNHHSLEQSQLSSSSIEKSLNSSSQPTTALVHKKHRRRSTQLLNLFNHTRSGSRDLSSIFNRTNNQNNQNTKAVTSKKSPSSILNLKRASISSPVLLSSHTNSSSSNILSNPILSTGDQHHKQQSFKALSQFEITTSSSDLSNSSHSTLSSDSTPSTTISNHHANPLRLSYLPIPRAQSNPAMSSVQAALYSSPHPQINHSHQSSSKNNHSTSESPNHSALAGFNRLITMGLPKTMMIHRKNPEYHSQCGIATPKSGKTLDNYNFNRRPSTSLTSEIQNSAPVLISNSAQLSSSTTSALLPRRRKAGYGQSRSERPSTASGSLTSTSLSSSVKASSSSSTTNIKLPCVILSTQVPNKQGLVFGQPIRRDKAQLPFIITRCLTYLNHWGCLEEGIYRIPGRASDVEKLKALFDAGCDVDLMKQPIGTLDPHAVASVFKLYLRQLPENLLTKDYEKLTQKIMNQYSKVDEEVINISSKSPSEVIDERLKLLKELVFDKLPPGNFHLVRSIAYHLATLANSSSTNRMTLSNLKLILSPTLRFVPIFLEYMVEYRDRLFDAMGEDEIVIKKVQRDHTVHVSKLNLAKSHALNKTNSRSPNGYHSDPANNFRFLPVSEARCDNSSSKSCKILGLQSLPDRQHMIEIGVAGYSNADLYKSPSDTRLGNSYRDSPTKDSPINSMKLSSSSSLSSSRTPIADLFKRKDQPDYLTHQQSGSVSSERSPLATKFNSAGRSYSKSEARTALGGGSGGGLFLKGGLVKLSQDSDQVRIFSEGRKIRKKKAEESLKEASKVDGVDFTENLNTSDGVTYERKKDEEEEEGDETEVVKVEEDPLARDEQMTVEKEEKIALKTEVEEVDVDKK